MTRAIAGLLALLGAMLVSACGVVGEDKTPDYRYRLTVEVETPEGLKTGSSVIEVEQRLVRPGSNPASRAVRRRVNGEAVAVDLPNGQTLFALLRSDNDPDWAGRVVQMLAPEIEDEPFEEVFDNIMMLDEAIVVPRMWPATVILPERTAYPKMVTFGDLGDPTSVKLVDPDELAATFGQGVQLKRITVELTDDPVTTEIEQRLGWLSDPALMGSPGWQNLPYDARSLIIGIYSGDHIGAIR